MIILSLGSFLISMILTVRTFPGFFLAVSNSLLVFIFSLSYLIYGIIAYFFPSGYDRAVEFTIQYGVKKAGFGQYKGLFALSLTAVLLIIWLTLWFYRVQRKKNKQSFKLTRWVWLLNLTQHFFLLVSVASGPGVSQVYAARKARDTSPSPLRHTVDKRLINDSNDFYGHYVYPSSDKIDPTQNLNLVFIYAESLERTYFNKTAFPGLMSNLSEKISSRGMDFSNIKQVSGTGFTIGGMVASQCGLPLFTTSRGNSMSGMDKFYEGAVCMSDLLHALNFNLTFIQGASLEFSGKGKFYSTHQFGEVLGSEEC
jgi:phosphoglycerol transferase